jgi:hypothetical protein
LPFEEPKIIRVPQNSAEFIKLSAHKPNVLHTAKFTPYLLQAYLSDKIDLSKSIEFRSMLAPSNQQEKANVLCSTNKSSNKLLKMSPPLNAPLLENAEYLQSRALYWNLNLNIANTRHECFSCKKVGITEHNPFHLLGCNKRKQQFTQRHDHIKFLFQRAFNTIGSNAKVETLPYDVPYQALKPDIEWTTLMNGRLLFDVQIISPHAKKHLVHAQEPLGAVKFAAELKINKYETASANIQGSFYPLVFDTYGNVAPQTQVFIQLLRAIARESLSFDTADQLVNTLEYDITCAIVRHNSRMLLQERCRQEQSLHSASSLHL